MRVGVPLHEAVEQTGHMRAGGVGAKTEVDSEGKRVPTEAELAKQNQKSMRELQALMGGLGT